MRDTGVASVQMESVRGDKKAHFAKMERFPRSADGWQLVFATLQGERE
jgi:hypothetical protein